MPPRAYRRRNWLPFEESRAHARSLGAAIQDRVEQVGCHVSKTQKNIPSNPRGIYSDQWAGWARLPAGALVLAAVP